MFLLSIVPHWGCLYRYPSRAPPTPGPSFRHHPPNRTPRHHPNTYIVLNSQLNLGREFVCPHHDQIAVLSPAKRPHRRACVLHLPRPTQRGASTGAETCWRVSGRVSRSSLPFAFFLCLFVQMIKSHICILYFWFSQTKAHKHPTVSSGSSLEPSSPVPRCTGISWATTGLRTRCFQMIFRYIPAFPYQLFRFLVCAGG